MGNRETGSAFVGLSHAAFQIRTGHGWASANGEKDHEKEWQGRFTWRLGRGSWDRASEPA